MSAADAVAAIQRLAAAFPHATIPDATLAVYAERLADLRSDLLAAAVNRLLDSAKFFPSVAEIRIAAGRIAGRIPGTAGEAAELIRRADVAEPVYRRDGSYAYTERYWRWPEDAEPATLEAARLAIAKVGDPEDADGKPRFGWEMGFKAAYESEAAIVTAAALADLSQAALPGPPALKLIEAPRPVLPAREDTRATDAAAHAVAQVTRMVADAAAMPQAPEDAALEKPRRQRGALPGSIPQGPPANERYFGEV